MMVIYIVINNNYKRTVTKKSTPSAFVRAPKHANVYFPPFLFSAFVRPQTLTRCHSKPRAPQKYSSRQGIVFLGG